MRTNVTKELILTHKEYDFLKNLYDEITIELYEEIDWNVFMWAIIHKTAFTDGGQKIIITYEDYED